MAQVASAAKILIGIDSKTLPSKLSNHQKTVNALTRMPLAQPMRVGVSFGIPMRE